MGNGWDSPNWRNLEQIEIIELQAELMVIQRLNGRLHSDHYAYGTGHFESVLAQFPRRTGGAYMHQFNPETEEHALQELNSVLTDFS
jgi:hypothetical protein